MGNKSLKNNKGLNNDDSNKKEIKSISKKRKKELIDFLLTNVVPDENIQKTNEPKILNKYFFTFISKFGNDKDFIDSNFILISNDIILLETKNIYKQQGNKFPIYLFFPSINENISYDIYNLIIENNNYNEIFSVIKVLNKKFHFENYFEIPSDNFDFASKEKYFINDKKEEESLGINIPKAKETNIKSYSLLSPIYIKSDNKLYLVGIYTQEKVIIIFNRDELKKIREKIDKIELKNKLYQIKKLDFSNHEINDAEMNYIFQYDYINLEYLDIHNKNLNDKGIKALQNKALANLKYLNLSNNKITDKGLTYLNYLSNLNELELFNMKNLSEDYFLSLENLTFINTISKFKCDKKKLSIENISSNYNNFILPNLSCVKLIDNTMEIHWKLKNLFLLNNICSSIKELDLSNTGITDNGIFRLTKNISILKNIEIINLENTAQLTDYCNKFFEEINKQNIKIIKDFKKLKQRTRKSKYSILLGGSTISGKTTYSNSYFTKLFDYTFMSTVGIDYQMITNSKYENFKFLLYDTSHWNGRFDPLIQRQIFKSDAVILLFDISKKEDFDNLNHCLRMISDYFELEEFPVLLIGNKADLEKNVNKDDIDKYVKENNFIGYFEVSSKTLLNVDESVDFMLNYIYEKEKSFPLNQKIIQKKGKK